MTNEEYTRLSSLISATAEQQAQFSVHLTGLGEQVTGLGEQVTGLGKQVSSLARQTAANNQGIRALLELAQIHEREQAANWLAISEGLKTTGEEIKAVNEGTKAVNEGMRETDERLNALIITVERFISGQR